MNTFTFIRPDDWHLHLRDGAALKTVVPHTAAQFARAVIMPNLKPPVTTVALAQDYARRIRAAVPDDCWFDPLMTLYLTDNLDPDEIRRAKGTQVSGGKGQVVAAKLYPAGATTNSDAGVTDLRKIYPVLDVMQREGLLLLVHGEVTAPEIDLFDRDAAQYVREAGPFTAATITAHHLLYNRNALFTGGLRPHFYCLPVLKRETHRLALVEAATHGNERFFLGTDSAPHPAHLKEHALGCAGCYTAHAALEMYAEVFDATGALDRFEAFASFNGPDFYGLPRNRGTITLRREPWLAPESYPFGDAVLKPLRGGEALLWKLCQPGSLSAS